jgi:hypothetical protein
LAYQLPLVDLDLRIQSLRFRSKGDAALEALASPA